EFRRVLFRSPGRVPQHRRGGHHRPSRTAVGPECGRRDTSQSLLEESLMTRASDTDLTLPRIGIRGTADAAPPVAPPAVMSTESLSVFYGDFLAVRDIGIDFARNEITALIGPSGCGKSTVLRCLNRMNDLIPSARVEGRVIYAGRDIYAAGIDPVEIRRRVGMVFQKPNP